MGLRFIEESILSNIANSIRNRLHKNNDFKMTPIQMPYLIPHIDGDLRDSTEFIGGVFLPYSNDSYNLYNAYQNNTAIMTPVCGDNVTNMRLAYYCCTNLSGSPVCGDNVTDMISAYYNCTNLTGSPVCGDNVTYMKYAYFGCKNLTGNAVISANLSAGYSSNASVTFMDYIYYNCHNVTTNMGLLIKQSENDSLLYASYTFAKTNMSLDNKNIIVPKRMFTFNTVGTFMNATFVNSTIIFGNDDYSYCPNMLKMNYGYNSLFIKGATNEYNRTSGFYNVSIVFMDDSWLNEQWKYNNVFAEQLINERSVYKGYFRTGWIPPGSMTGPNIPVTYGALQNVRARIVCPIRDDVVYDNDELLNTYAVNIICKLFGSTTNHGGLNRHLSMSDDANEFSNMLNNTTGQHRPWQEYYSQALERSTAPYWELINRVSTSSESVNIQTLYSSVTPVFTWKDFVDNQTITIPVIGDNTGKRFRYKGAYDTSNTCQINVYFYKQFPNLYLLPLVETLTFNEFTNAYPEVNRYSSFRIGLNSESDLIIRNMKNAFAECTNLSGSPVCGNSVINMAFTYYGCSKLTGSPVCGNNVTGMGSAYYGCTNLSGSPVCGNNVTDMKYAYYGCKNLTGSPVCGDNVTDMKYAYYRCYNLTGSPVCGNSVINMDYAYYGCKNLNANTSPVFGINTKNISHAYEDSVSFKCNGIYLNNITNYSFLNITNICALYTISKYNGSSNPKRCGNICLQGLQLESTLFRHLLDTNRTAIYISRGNGYFTEKSSSELNIISDELFQKCGDGPITAVNRVIGSIFGIDVHSGSNYHNLYEALNENYFTVQYMELQNNVTLQMENEVLDVGKQLYHFSLSNIPGESSLFGMCNMNINIYPYTV